MSGEERTDAERLRSAEITLATIRDHAERSLRVSGATGHAGGYEHAMRDVVTILDSRWMPEGEPVVFGGQP